MRLNIETFESLVSEKILVLAMMFINQNKNLEGTTFTEQDRYNMYHFIKGFIKEFTISLTVYGITGMFWTRHGPMVSMLDL